MYKFTSSKPKWRTDSSNFLHFHVTQKKQEGDTVNSMWQHAADAEKTPQSLTRIDRIGSEEKWVTRASQDHMISSQKTIYRIGSEAKWVTRASQDHTIFTWDHLMSHESSVAFPIATANSMCHRGRAQLFLGGNASIFHGCSCNLQTRLTICIPVWEPVLDWYHLLCSTTLGWGGGVCVYIKMRIFLSWFIGTSRGIVFRDMFVLDTIQVYLAFTNLHTPGAGLFILKPKWCAWVDMK